jgi:hypothetical protein
VTTANGSLVITTRAEKTSWTEWDAGSLRPVTATKNYTSGTKVIYNCISSPNSDLDGSKFRHGAVMEQVLLHGGRVGDVHKATRTR